MTWKPKVKTERETERQTQTDRETDGETDRETEGNIQRVRLHTSEFLLILGVCKCILYTQF